MFVAGNGNERLLMRGISGDEDTENKDYIY